jgi:tetratricopeptide (TPR) repeat protein
VATESLFPFRFAASERRAVLVGRTSEMRELEHAYALAKDRRETRTVTVLGATGIGKTRLVREFLVRMRELGAGPRVFRGSTREGGPAYEVFARVLRGRFGIVEAMDAEAAKAQVRAQLAAVLEDRKIGDVAYFLGQLLELSFQDSPLIRAVEGDPAQIRAMRRAVIKNFLETDAGKGDEPLVLVFDDLQWAHDDSLELLAYLVESLRGPILLVCITRPEMLARRDGWRRFGNDRHIEVELGPLGDEDASAVAHDLLAPCGTAPGLSELIETAVTLAGGNPALVEQIVRIYHEAGVLVATDDFDDERWTIHPDKLAQVRLPFTVEDAVAARIASLLPEDRELLERAAAMGGVFWLGGLVALERQAQAPPEVWEGGEADDVVALRQRLSDLVDRDYVLRLPDSTFAGDEEYVFKHNLEREALLRLTPPAAARKYHRGIAEWLSFRTSVETSEEYLEMLARHREKAGAVALAASAFVRAAEVARKRSANAKAAELYAKGLKLLDECDHVDEDLRLRSMHNYGDVLYALGRNDAAHATFVEMLARAWRLDLRHMGGTAHARIGRLLREMGRLGEASRQLTAALALFGQAQDDRGTASVLDGIGKLHRLKGDQPLALEYTLRSLALRRKVGDRQSVAVSLHRLGSIQHDAGNYRAAVEAFDQALRIRREIGDLVARDVRDDKRAAKLFQDAYDAAKETGDRNRTALILANLGATHDRLGDGAAALAALQQAQELTDELGDLPALAAALRGLGRAHFERRDYARARELMERAAKVFTDVQSTVELGITLRSLADAISAQAGGYTRDAADALKRSIGIFEKVGNDTELGKSCRTLAALLRRSPQYASDRSVAAEATAFETRAEGIAAKARANAATEGPEVPIEAAFAN